MAQRRHLPRFFLDIYENDDYLETDNKEEAYARFYASQFSCVLFENGRLVADKEWVEEEVDDSGFCLNSQVYTDGEHVGLEEVEVV